MQAGWQDACLNHPGCLNVPGWRVSVGVAEIAHPLPAAIVDGQPVGHIRARVDDGEIVGRRRPVGFRHAAMAGHDGLEAHRQAVADRRREISCRKPAPRSRTPHAARSASSASITAALIDAQPLLRGKIDERQSNVRIGQHIAEAVIHAVARVVRKDRLARRSHLQQRPAFAPAIAATALPPGIRRGHEKKWQDLDPQRGFVVHCAPIETCELDLRPARRSTEKPARLDLSGVRQGVGHLSVA